MRIDLNFPDFQKDFFTLQKNEGYALIKTFKILSRMDFDQLRRSPGLNLERIKNMKTRKGNSLYSIRITRSFRAVISIQDDYLRFISLHPDHDSAYKK
ncbi:MAG: hypothetical protein K9N10_01320 [Deltaproteobacteria bacterium]|nr:hypothetical protein [Deltaproteobacteria bacterium]